MKIDSSWTEEAVKTGFEFWEGVQAQRNPAYVQRTWEEIPEEHKGPWREHYQAICEMVAAFVLLDAWHYFNAQGIQGGSLVRALQSYALENLQHEIDP